MEIISHPRTTARALNTGGEYLTPRRQSPGDSRHGRATQRKPARGRQAGAGRSRDETTEEGLEVDAHVEHGTSHILG